MAATHSIRGGGDLELHVREWGKANGDSILFIHGWSASHMAWRYQYESELADEFRLVALDLRGHGMSEAPRDASSYREPRLWAEDIAAIIEALGLDRPILVGWSYGGYVIGDYLRTFGQSSIGGVNYVGGGVTFNQASFGTRLGPGFLNYVPGATKPDLPESIDAIRQFLREMVATPMSREDFERALAFNMVVPPEVRGALVQREIEADDLLREMTVPVLVTQGKKDRHVLPAMAEHILEVCPTATASWYEEVAHMPFLENPARFNAELAELARRQHAGHQRAATA